MQEARREVRPSLTQEGRGRARSGIRTLGVETQDVAAAGCAIAADRRPPWMVAPPTGGLHRDPLLRWRRHRLDFDGELHLFANQDAAGLEGHVPD